MWARSGQVYPAAEVGVEAIRCAHTPAPVRKSRRIWVLRAVRCQRSLNSPAWLVT